MLSGEMALKLTIIIFTTIIITLLYHYYYNIILSLLLLLLCWRIMVMSLGYRFLDYRGRWFEPPAASVCCVFEQDTLSALLQSTQL